MEAWRYGRERQSDRKQFRSNGGKSGRERRVCGGRRAAGAHEALPHTSPGGKPPETPGPLSLGLDCTEARPSVKGSLRRQKPAALSLGLASEHNIPVMRERGPTDRAHIKPPVGRQRSLSRPAAARALRAHEALPHAPPGGQAPLRPPIRGAYLTETGLLMEAATVRERSGAVNSTRSAVLRQKPATGRRALAGTCRALPPAT